MSFLGGVFDDIGSAVGSLFGGSDSAAAGGDASGGIGNALLTAASSALNSPMQQPSSPGGMGQFGPHQNSSDSPQGPANSRALTSEDPRQLEEQWLARMARFRTLQLATRVPNYKGGE